MYLKVIKHRRVIFIQSPFSALLIQKQNAIFKLEHRQRYSTYIKSLIFHLPWEEVGTPEVELEVDNEAASGFRTLFSNSRLSLILRSPASRNL